MAGYVFHMLRFWEHVVISLSIEMHVPCGIGDLSWSKISNDYTWYTVLVFFNSSAVNNSSRNSNEYETNE